MIIFILSLKVYVNSPLPLPLLLEFLRFKIQINEDENISFITDKMETML